MSKPMSKPMERDWRKDKVVADEKNYFLTLVLCGKIPPLKTLDLYSGCNMLRFSFVCGLE